MGIGSTVLLVESLGFPVWITRKMSQILTQVQDTINIPRMLISLAHI